MQESERDKAIAADIRAILDVRFILARHEQIRQQEQAELFGSNDATQHRAMSEKQYQCKKWLQEQYWGKRLSTLKMAALVGCSSSTIQNWLAYYKIPIRNLSEAQKAGYDSTTLEGKTRRKKLSKAMKTSRAWGVYDGVFQSPTSIEIAVSEALDILGIEHEQQYKPDGYSCIYDEFISPDVLVEVQGDYWHSSDEAQERDAEKAAWARDNDYHLVAIWEHEINEVGALALVEERVIPLL